MEKVIAAGISSIVSRAAVTEEAIHLARKNKITVYGFVRNGNLYSDSMFKNRFL
ncbi:formate dehydrogenase accessory sulfurtransferase FdhD [uncultured Blautia sp.]|uniref:formate dehydrogenase accessory sulfurtransferase FdhD n=1 Tax=Blautia sp. TaxID=1955243 RepID=UPI0034DDC9A7